MLAVDFAVLNDARADIARSIEHAEDVLAALSKQVARLAEMWTGAASEGFQRTLAEWMAGQQDLQRQLQELHDLVVTAHSNHAQAVRGNVAIWQV
ncbi:WXG100 family type VII secretion target [Gandjariella thermophila]|uniref:ESAT-6-like protein n=1 Tax=Gandjariella thermophila TaxID=1931992 RepID=A0A4D4JHW1_9PSEU|nr:WXG100 family type VII secretion target [Gandjariella thermophila]GDY33986.1 hypothetical protein GTS_56190 [Gandjariella thermophila]